MENRSLDIPPEMATQTLSVEVHEAEIVDPKKRLKFLLSIAERDRTDEQWDEIIELEIQLAPGNRTNANAPFPNKMRNKNPSLSSAPQHTKKRPRANNFRRMRNNKSNNNNPAPAGF